LCVFAPLRETSATNAEQRLYFFFPLRLCAFAGNSIGNECGGKTLLLLSFASLGLCGKTASATNAEERLYFVSPLRLCAFAGNSIGNECGGKTLLRLSFASLRLGGKQHLRRMRRKDSTSSSLCVFAPLRE